MKLIGIDIGGTKVSISVGDEKGTIYGSMRIATRELEGPEVGLPKLVASTLQLLAQLQVERAEVKAIGLAVPGPASTKTGCLLTPPNMPQWVHVPIVSYLKEKLTLPIFMDNDANAGALGEWHFGAAKRAASLIYLTMSTGMGGGVIIDGKILRGATDTAGEVGHYVLDREGPKCFCGQRGCFEAFCGGARVAQQLQEGEGKLQTVLLEEVGGQKEKIDLKVLLRAVGRGDPFAQEFWQEYIERLAQGIGILLQTLNPDVIILGTIAAHNKKLVLDPLLRALPRYAWQAPLTHCRIEPTSLGDNLGKVGALAVAINGLKGKS